MRARSWLLVFMWLVMACTNMAPKPPAHAARLATQATTPTATATPTRQAALFQPWNAEAFALAAQQRRILIVSVQTQWCHWCHVMKAQTFADPEVRALLDKHFVVIAVDADARPDLGTRYAAWGWPATALLTPDAEPIVNLRGYQEPRAFAALLRDLSQRLERGQNLANVTPIAVPMDADLAARRDALRARLTALRDPVQLGYGAPKKFPWVAPIDDAFIVGSHDPQAQETLRYALSSLERYAVLIDPVAGGMFQYSVFNRWDRPHYEKIHAVQADALRTFAQAYRVTGERRFLDHARAIERYVTGPLRSRDGTFFANQDADVGHVGQQGFLRGQQYYALDAAGRALVNDPQIDDSIYANNNGMTIAALCALYEATLDHDVLQSAIDAMTRIELTHAQGALYRHDAVGNAMLYLDDQVQMAEALFALHQATADVRHWQRLTRLIMAIETTFGDRDAMPNETQRLDVAGFFAHTPDPQASGALAVAQKTLQHNSQLARLLLRMHAIDDSAGYRQRALATLNAVVPQTSDPMPGRGVFEHLRALSIVDATHAVLTVVAPIDDAAGKALYRAALASDQPLRLARWQTPETSHYPFPGHAVLYLCTQDSCSMPIEHADDVAPAARALLTETRAEH